MRKPGDILTIFGNPLKCKHPIDQARLIKKLSEQGQLEQWLIEYTNDEGHFYEALIKKEDSDKIMIDPQEPITLY